MLDKNTSNIVLMYLQLVANHDSILSIQTKSYTISVNTDEVDLNQVLHAILYRHGHALLDSELKQLILNLDQLHRHVITFLSC